MYNSLVVIVICSSSNSRNRVTVRTQYSSIACIYTQTVTNIHVKLYMYIAAMFSNQRCDSK